MKKAAIVFLIAVTVYACSRKTITTTDTKTPLPVNTGTTAAAPPLSMPADDAQAMLADKGKTVYTNRCGRCHGLKKTEKWSADEWDNILKAMIPKAGLNDEESKQVTAYVHMNAKK